MRSVKILIVAPAWVGDMVMAQALFRLLRTGPEITIDVIAPPWAVGLFARMPEVRRAIGQAAGHGEVALGRRWRLGRKLRGEAYTRAIVLPRSFKSALVPFFARIPLRTGFRTELRQLVLNDTRGLDRTILNQTVKRFLALGLAPAAVLPEPPQPALTADPANRTALLQRLGLSTGAPVVALLPGAAYGPAKQWPLEHFGQLARRLRERGNEIWVLGAAAERGLGESIRAAAGAAVHNLCGETRLEDTVDLLSLARVAVTNDSGLMHVAAASGTHVVAIYGSSSPAFTPPLTDRKTVLYLSLECSPCFERECPLGHLRCLRDISPEWVAALPAFA